MTAAGTATVTNGEVVITVHKNQSTYIPIGSKHRLENHKTEMRDGGSVNRRRRLPNVIQAEEVETADDTAVVGAEGEAITVQHPEQAD